MSIPPSSTQFPARFYRIDYPSSQTHYDPETGDLTALDYDHYKRSQLTSDLFWSTIDNHLNWYHESTFLISVFDDARHAMNWAQNRVDKGRAEEGEVRILVYNGTMVGNRRWRRVWKVHDILKKDKAPWSNDEWLVEMKIDGEALIEERRLSCKCKRRAKDVGGYWIDTDASRGRGNQVDDSACTLSLLQSITS